MPGLPAGGAPGGAGSGGSAGPAGGALARGSPGVGGRTAVPGPWLFWSGGNSRRLCCIRGKIHLKKAALFGVWRSGLLTERSQNELPGVNLVFNLSKSVHSRFP